MTHTVRKDTEEGWVGSLEKAKLLQESMRKAIGKVLFEEMLGNLMKRRAGKTKRRAQRETGSLCHSVGGMC